MSVWRTERFLAADFHVVAFILTLTSRMEKSYNNVVRVSQSFVLHYAFCSNIWSAQLTIASTMAKMKAHQKLATAKPGTI